MKINKWTWALATLGVVSFSSAVSAEEAQHQVLTALSSTTLSGYVDTSAIWKFGTGNANLPGRSFDGPSKQDGFNLNVVKLTLEKPLAESQFSAGYKADLIFGPDAVGYNPSVGSFPSDVGIKQAYIALRAPIGNGLDFKIGTWDTIIGYEVFESGNNPNYSRSYGYALEPTEHTGILATYTLNEIVSFAAGVANTWSAGINNRLGAESQKTYMASVSLTCPDTTSIFGGSTLYLGFVNGLSGNPENTTSYYAGLVTKTPLEALNIGAAFDYRTDGTQLNAAGVNILPVENWAWATSLYLLYQATDKLNINTRVEYTTGTAGTYGVVNNAGAPLGDAVKLGGLTITADYSLWENVLTRAEFRWDHSFSGAEPFGGTVPGAPDQKNAVSLAANIIYKF